MRQMIRTAFCSLILLFTGTESSGQIAFDPRSGALETHTIADGVATGYLVMEGRDGVVCESLPAGAAAEMQLRVSKRAVALRPIHDAAPRTNAGGLQIVLMGTVQLDGFPEARAAFIRAAQAWEAVILNPITVVLEADFGPTAFGEAFSGNLVVGVTLASQFGVQYSTFRNRMVGTASNAREVSLFPLLPASGIQSDIGLGTNVLASGSLLEALGIGPSQGTSFNNPRIGFNSRFNFDTNRTDGIAPNLVDFETVAIHEIGHALGFTSFVGQRELESSFPAIGAAMDLYRFRPGTTLGTILTAQRVLSSGGEHRFFAAAPELALSTGRPDGTGGDQQQAGHFKAASITGVRLGIMDPQVQQGAIQNIMGNDLLVFDTIGYAIVTAGTPAGPSGLTAQAASQTEANLVWSDNSTTESGFHLYVAQGNRPFNRVGSTAANSTSVRLTGLLPGETFRFTITAFNDAGESQFAAIASATLPGTPAATPAAPTNLTATEASATSVTLRWEDNASNEAGFNVYTAEGNGEFELLGSTGPNTVGGTVSGLAPGSHVRFRVTAFNDAGESAPSNIAQVGSPPASRRRPARR